MKSGGSFAHGVQPLHDAGKLGAILLQFAPWIQPARNTPAMFARAREQLGDLPVAVEFRHPSWLEPERRERLWDQLRDHGMTYVVADTPPGTRDQHAARPSGDDARPGDRSTARHGAARRGARGTRRWRRNTATSTTTTSSKSGCA